MEDRLSLRSWRASDGERQATGPRFRGYALVLRRRDGGMNQVVSDNRFCRPRELDELQHPTYREMLLIQNSGVNWETCQVGIPGDQEDKHLVTVAFEVGAARTPRQFRIEGCPQESLLSSAQVRELSFTLPPQ